VTVFSPFWVLSSETLNSFKGLVTEPTKLCIIERFLYRHNSQYWLRQRLHLFFHQNSSCLMTTSDLNNRMWCNLIQNQKEIKVHFIDIIRFEFFEFSFCITKWSTCIFMTVINRYLSYTSRKCKSIYQKDFHHQTRHLQWFPASLPANQVFKIAGTVSFSWTKTKGRPWIN
jgi:hypothetical protein